MLETRLRQALKKLTLLDPASALVSTKSCCAARVVSQYAGSASHLSCSGPLSRQHCRRLQPEPESRSSTSDESRRALRDVTFDAREREAIAFVGRHGAGKSTLLKIPCRISHLIGGRAEIRGRVGLLLGVGSGFHPELSGREEVHLNGAFLGTRKAEMERTFDDIVAFAEEERFIDTPIMRYSTDMYARLASAVAKHLAPENLLVDEHARRGRRCFPEAVHGQDG